MWRIASPVDGREAAALTARSARELLATPRDVAALHGDIHHDNILDFGARGRLAIAPKGLLGERGFDYANIFCNPKETAAAPGRLSRQASTVAEASGLERVRLLQWILAYAGFPPLGSSMKERERSCVFPWRKRRRRPARDLGATKSLFRAPRTHGNLC